MSVDVFGGSHVPKRATEPAHLLVPGSRGTWDVFYQAPGQTRTDAIKGPDRNPRGRFSSKEAAEQWVREEELGLAHTVSKNAAPGNKPRPEGPWVRVANGYAYLYLRARDTVATAKFLTEEDAMTWAQEELSGLAHTVEPYEPPEKDDSPHFAIYPRREGTFAVHETTSGGRYVGAFNSRADAQRWIDEELRGLAHLIGPNQRSTRQGVVVRIHARNGQWAAYAGKEVEHAIFLGDFPSVEAVKNSPRVLGYVGSRQPVWRISAGAPAPHESGAETRRLAESAQFVYDRTRAHGVSGVRRCGDEGYVVFSISNGELSELWFPTLALAEEARTRLLAAHVFEHEPPQVLTESEFAEMVGVFL